MSAKPKKKPTAPKWAVLTPKLLSNGRWMVSLGIIKGKNLRRKFGTKADAQDFCNQERARRKAHGSLTADADGTLVAAWLALDADLQTLGADSLLAIGQRHLDALRVIRRTGTARECLTACHAALVEDGRSGDYTGDILNRGGRFLRWFGEDRPVSEITPIDIANYFSTISDKSKSNRGTISGWLGWAVDEGWLATNPCTRKRRKGTKNKVKAQAVTLTPLDAGRLLSVAVEAEEWEILSYLTISLFAGLRPHEFRKRSKDAGPLDLTWAEIKSTGIVVPPYMAKTGVGRVVPINQTLAAWLELIRAKKGVCRGPIMAAGNRGGWRRSWDRFRAKYWLDEYEKPIKWHPDQLRHSFGSYSLAKRRDAAGVSTDMGNSPTTLYKHYWNWETLSSEAEEFFKITPNTIKKT